VHKALAIAGLSACYTIIAAGFILLIKGALDNPQAVIKGFIGFVAAIIILVIVTRIAAIPNRG
jgi:hypothetical protein